MATGKRHPILTEADLDRITASVTEVEKATQGEIVPMVAARSGPYQSAHWRIAVSFCWLASATLAYFRADLETGSILFLQALLLGVGWVLSKSPFLLRAVISRHERAEQVHQHAVEAFFHHHLHRTTGQTGVLVFISCLERRVVILADEGIHGKVEAGTWNKVISEMLPLIRRGEIAEALNHGVRSCGAVLAAHFPAASHLNNELPNRPIVED